VEYYSSAHKEETCSIADFYLNDDLDLNITSSPIIVEQNFGPEPLPKDLFSLVGTTGYYYERAMDFRRRNPQTDLIPYYLSYGEKYQKRFLKLRSEVESSKLEQWIIHTHRNLQHEIEKKRHEDPFEFATLEKEEMKFQQFCFESHPRAYVNSGFCHLSFFDLFTVALTPDLSDILTYDGILQVLVVASECSTVWVDRILNGFGS
jgi:hypothetical protein